MDKKYVAVITVLYNPGKEVKENILRYKDAAGIVYCIDNSSSLHEEYTNINGIEYVPLYNNRGIAYALNAGCRKAVRAGYKVIISMDQDTYCEPETIEVLVKCLEISNRKFKNCVIAPNVKYIYRNDIGERIFSKETVYPLKTGIVKWVITAGCAFTAETYKETGGFDSSLFIGQADNDFCFKVNKLGGRIIRLSNTFIYQEPGRTKKRTILGKIVHVPYLPPIRYYYVFRNDSYLSGKWGKDYSSYRIPALKYLGSIILFENNKLKKLAWCAIGTVHGRRMSKDLYEGYRNYEKESPE